MAGLPTLGLPALLVGVSTMGTGGAAMDVPIIIGSQAQADASFGEGSQLSRMFKSFFKNNWANQVYGLPVSPGVGAVAATANIVVTTPPTAPGTINLYIGGEHVQCNVAPSDTTTVIATNLAAEINDVLDISVLATTTPPGTVKLTCNWAGISGNDITLMMNYYGTVGGEITPPGLVMTVPATLTGGSGSPLFTNAIANLGEQNFEYVALPLTDAVTLNAWETEYGFADTGRWGWQRQLYGHLFAAHRDTYSNQVTFGLTRNSGVTSIMAVEPGSPSPTFEWAAAYAAKAQRALVNDPARPLQTLSLNGIKLAPLQQRFNTPEINTLAQSGLATQKAGSDNQPMISRETTTYQLNLYGNPDTAYELVTTLATLAKLIRNQKQAITSKFPRMKLASDGTRFGPGQAIVTPNIIKGELIAEYASDMYNGLVENLTDFSANLLVERDSSDANRLNVLYPPDLINQLRVFAVLAQFRLQYNANIDPVLGANIGVTGIIPAGGIPA
jgi:phage tail sheath gpL-like